MELDSHSREDKLTQNKLTLRKPPGGFSHSHSHAMLLQIPLLFCHGSGRIRGKKNLMDNKLHSRRMLNSIERQDKEAQLTLRPTKN